MVVKKLKKDAQDNAVVILTVRLSLVTKDTAVKDSTAKVVKDFTAKVANNIHPIFKFNRNKGQLRK